MTLTGQTFPRRCTLQTGYTAEFFRLLKKGEKIDADEKKMGWVECVENGKVRLSDPLIT